MTGHVLGDLQLAAVLEVGGDTGGSETVRADPSAQPSGFGPFLNHQVHIGLGQGNAAGQPAVTQGREERRVGFAGESGRGDPLLQILVEVVMAGQLGYLAALLVKPDPTPALLNVVVPDAHAGRRSDAGEGVAHKRDEGAIAESEQGSGVDGGQELVHLLGREHGGLSFADAVLRSPNSMGGIGVYDVAGDQPIKQHADRGQVLLHGRFGMRAAELLDVGCDVHGRHPSQVPQTSFRAPGREGLDSFEIGAASVRVADVDGEEFPKALVSFGCGLEQRDPCIAVRNKGRAHDASSVRAWVVAGSKAI